MLVQEKVEQAKKIVQEFGVDCWITFVRESEINGDPTLDFLLGAPVTWHSAFIITPEKTFAIVGKYDRATVVDSGAYDEVYDFVESFKPDFQKVLTKLNPRRIAVNYSTGSEICDGITYGMFLTLRESLAGIGMDDRLESAEKLVSALRQRKSDEELARMRSAIVHTEEIYNQVGGFIQPGRTEKEVAGFIHEQIAHRGLGYAWDPATCPAVFTGPDTAGAHYSPSDRVIEPGHLISIDFGVRFDGYCSDIQRNFYVLRPGETKAPDKVQHAYDTIVTAIEKVRQAMRPGALPKDMDQIAREYVVERGYPEFPFGLGHQVGRFVHDGTALMGPAWEKYAQKPFHLLEERMVFTIEPRVDVDGHGIVSLEEMVVVEQNGASFLTNAQTKPRLIKVG
jgi:Xaa-Pro aminopeptidase